jgi:putative restriction endonuclease
MATGRNWTRKELLVALNIYRKLTFGQLHARNRVIIDLAAKLRRSANSVAMKLCNFASLDPVLSGQGIRGLQGASNLDRKLWSEFQLRPIDIAAESEESFRTLMGAKENEEVEVDKKRGIQVTPPTGATEKLATVKIRRSQQFFRQMILNAFDSQCCVTGLPIRELLVASHILPWGKFPKERLNPQNGLCLSRLHDAAFDAKLMSFDENRCLIMSKRLKTFLAHQTVKENFEAFAGLPLRIPKDAIPPSDEFLKFHRDHLFQQ